MPDPATVLAGLSDALTLTNLLFVLGGVVLGQVIGALPGVGPVMAIAIPFTIVIDPLPAVAIGSLVMAEILRRLSQARRGSGPVLPPVSADPADRRVSLAEYWACRFTIARGALIGTALGALPGIGSTAAAFMSCASARQVAKDPGSSGKGNSHGVAATESANSSVIGANLIPTLTLGIPGSVDAALIISAFMIHGVQPGPLPFERQGRLVYGLFGAMVLATAMNLTVGLAGLRLRSLVIRAPEPVIFAGAILFWLAGVALTSGGLFGIAVMLVFAMLGWLMTSFGYPVIVFIIAFFLGERFETSLSQSLVLLQGDPARLAGHPIALALLGLSVVAVCWLHRRRPALEEAGSPLPAA